jgi:hypothetical protein
MTKRIENTLRWIVRISLVTIGSLAALFMLGTIGAVDAGHVSLGAGALRCLGSMGLSMFCFDLVC